MSFVRYSLPPTDELALVKGRKSSAVYHALKRAILLYEKKPGAPLTEQQLAAELGCSQGTVREALLRLQEDGLVIRAGYRGSYVSKISVREAAEMIHLRRHIETRGVRRAATMLDADDVEQLTALVDTMTEAGQDGDLYRLSEYDRAFHLTLFKAAGLDALEPILIRCALNMHRYTVADKVDRQRSVASARDHYQIIDALKTADPDAAAAALGAHIDAIVDGGPAPLRAALAEDVTL